MVASAEAVPPPPVPQVYIPSLDSGSIRWTAAFPSLLRAGLIAAGLMVFPVVGFGLGMVGAGVLAILFYRRRVPGVNPTMSQGAGLGAITGLLAFLFFSAFVAIELLSGSMRAQFRQAALDAIQHAAERSADPQAQQVIEFFKTPSGFALMFIMGALVVAVLFVVLSGLAGLITAYVAGPKHDRARASVPDGNKNTASKDRESSEHELRPK